MGPAVAAGDIQVLRKKLLEFQPRVVEIDVRGCDPVKVHSWGDSLRDMTVGRVDACDCNLVSGCTCDWPMPLTDSTVYGNPWSAHEAPMTTSAPSTTSSCNCHVKLEDPKCLVKEQEVKDTIGIPEEKEEL